MAKNIHQMIILDIDTDQTRSENIDPNYWNYFSREKYWLHCLSYENIEWIVVAKKNVNQMKKCRAWNKNFSPFNPSYTMIKFRSKLLNYFSDKKYRLNVEVAKNVNWLSWWRKMLIKWRNIELKIWIWVYFNMCYLSIEFWFRPLKSF